jgi:hypothetical protein
MLAVSSISSRWTFCPCGPVWCVTSVMPKICFGILLGLGLSARHLHAAALAAASGVNLRLDDHAARASGKKFAGRRRSFFQRVGHLARGTATPYFARIVFA